MRRVNHSDRFRERLSFYMATRGLEYADWLMAPACYLLRACDYLLLLRGSAVTSVLVTVQLFAPPTKFLL